MELRFVNKDYRVAYLLPDKVERYTDDLLFTGAKSAKVHWIRVSIDSIAELLWSFWVDWL